MAIARAFASNLAKGFGLDTTNKTLVMLIALGFMALVLADPKRHAIASL